MSAIGAFREPIAQSWHRATSAGLDPEAVFDQVVQGEVDQAGPLLAAALPVLNELTTRLEGSDYSSLLVDRQGRVAHRWCDDRDSLRAFDALGLEVGTSLVEELVGTNAPGTVLETRRSMSVNSVEHFAVPLRQFSCYGHPIFHPTTRRIEGVLDLSVLADTTNPLLPALVAGAVADIEQRLLDGGRASDRELLAAFQRQSGRRRAVVAIGHDLLMSNQAAMAMLGTADFALLKIIAGDVRDDSSITITLESGVEATVRAARVGGTRTGALLEIEGLHKRSVGGRPALPRSQEPILISGPPGSGRSTQVRQIARTRPLAVLSAASALLDGPAAWVRDFDAAVGTGQGLVCVDGVDLLDDDVLAVVMNRLGDGSRIAQLILVSGPVENLTGRAAALAGLCTERVELLPLANRVSELPRVVSTMIRAVGGPATLHLTPGALQTLAAQPWPGNLRELRTVVEYVVGRRSDGAITVDDLPEAYRSSGPARQMAPIERAERSAIIAALRENDGNKVRTAESLGISRTTLYAKMRSLRISTY